MASYKDAREARDAVFEHIAGIVKSRPGAVGILAVGDKSFGIKITLSRKPTTELPSVVYGIPVRYDLVVGQPELVGGTEMAWYKRVAKNET